MMLLLALLGGRGAWAAGKAPIAILGLEVYDNGGGIEPETTKAAKELTAALRDRAKAGTGPYAPVPGGEKELIDEKLLNNCDSEQPSCMAAIGSGLGAEVLMYGKIEKVTQGGQAIYKVSIKLLNVNRKQLASSLVETLPLTEATGVRASAHAKAWYAKLAGGSAGGTVVVRANIDRGTVMLDDDLKGNLASGTLTIHGVAEGRHTLAIEAKDFQRYETSITVRNGESLPHNATMVEMSKKPLAPTGNPLSVEGTVGTKSGSNGWKPVFYGATVLTAGAAGFSVLTIIRANAEAEKINTDPKLSNADCGKDLELSVTDGKNFKKACDWYKYQKVGWVVTGVAGAAMIGSFVMAYLRDGDHTESKNALIGRKKRRELAITPIVTPDGGGATLRFDW
ncbi:MAG: PEGA domain-containing protein [Myxococcales bacterium]|nr:PEGA domain-containing protein [Myxococcales bacterium]